LNDNKPYNERVISKIKELKNLILADQKDEKDKGEEWEHEVLIYFAGHGESKDGPLEFDTPSVDDSRTVGFLEFEDVVKWLSDPDMGVVRRIFIVDACRAKPGRKESDEPNTDFVALNMSQTYQATRTKWDYYFSTQRGGYSYEQGKFGLGDIVPEFDLWSASSVPKSGNGVFTLGLMTSLLCGDAIDYPEEKAYNVDISRRYLANWFFSARNQKWVEFKADLIHRFPQDEIEDLTPEPQHISLDDVRRSFVFRNLNGKPRNCLAPPTEAQR
jgi:hypothetical protein